MRERLSWVLNVIDLGTDDDPGFLTEIDSDSDVDSR